MKRMGVFATLICSLVAIAVCNDAEGARRCRPVRRVCAGAVHQPIAAASIRAPRSESSVTGYTECICALWPYAQWNGYYSYYAMNWQNGCDSGFPVSLDGNFTILGGDPCPTCPAAQCLYFEYASLTPGRRFKPGTKLDQKLDWDQKLVLNSGTGKLKVAGGKERAIEFEVKELADARLLVSFTSGNVQYFAKLHTCRVEAQELDGAKAARVADFSVGQEINPPPAGQKVHDVTGQVKILSPNTASIRIGNTTYQVVTATPMAD